MNKTARLLSILSIALLAAACGAEAPAEPQMAAPDFNLSALGGGEVALADYQGKVLLVEFWATWCSPCRAQAAILDELYEEYSRRGDVEFIGVSVGEKEETVKTFVDKMSSPFPYPVALDPDDVLSSELMVYALPTVMIIDRDSNVAYFQSGLSPAGVLRRELEAALSS